MCRFVYYISISYICYPVPLPCKHWFASIVNAVVELVKHIIEFVVLLYIPLVPSLNKIVDEYVEKIDTVLIN